MKNYVLGLLLVGILLCMVASCQRNANPIAPFTAITMAENKQRALIGLRLVKTNWFLYSVQFNEENWKISPNKYLAKKINRDSKGVIQWEEDYYYSGKTFMFPPDKGKEWEMVTIHYDYTTKQLTVFYIGLDPSITALFGDDGPISIKTNDMPVADSILKKWGLPRL